MSLINQMLQDLEARHEGDARARLHREVRSLPVQRESHLLKVAGVALAIAALGGGGAWAYLQWSAERQTPMPAVKSEPAPAVAVAPVAALSAPEAAPVVAASPVAESEAAPAAPVPVSLDPTSGLKLSAGLDRLPAVPAPSATEVAPATVASPASRKASAPVDGVAARGAEKKQATVAPESPLPAVPVLPESARKAPVKSVAAPAQRVASGGVEKTPSAGSARDRSETEYRRAVALVNGARVTEAIDVLLDVLRVDGGHVGARQLVAKLLIEQRRRDEAAAILAEGLAALPSQTGWAMTLARLQVDRGDLAAAGKTLQHSLSFGSGSPDYLGFYGLVQHRLGQQKEAAAHYLAAARLAPSDGRWWLGLGLALEADHQSAEAREAFVRARATGSLGGDLAALVDQKLR